MRANISKKFPPPGTEGCDKGRGKERWRLCRSHLIGFLIQGFTTRHWIGTAGVVTVMVLAAAGCWAAIQVSTYSNLAS
jgi:hypothetical protein